MFTLGSHQNKQSTGENMTEQEYLSAIANLADKVSRYHERLMAAERDLERHLSDENKHRCESCECENR